MARVSYDIVGVMCIESWNSDMFRGRLGKTLPTSCGSLGFADKIDAPGHRFGNVTFATATQKEMCPIILTRSPSLSEE
jgi:hypothetical protein